MRILGIVEDGITELLERALWDESLDSEVTDDAGTGTELALLYQYQAIVISDYVVAPNELPTLLVKLRKAKLRASIVILGSADLSTRVGATVDLLRAGADDYLPRPFHMSELVASLVATSRRYSGNYQNEFVLGPATVDTYRRQVLVGSLTMPFTNKEYLLCEALAMSRGRTLSKQKIIEQVYGGFSDVETKIVDVYVFKVRDKLRRVGLIDPTQAIETVWGRGYRACDPPTNTAGAT